MDGIFGALIWLIIIFIWAFSALKKTRRKDSDVKKEAPSELEKKILEALGMSFPEIPEPTIQKPPEPKPSEPKIEEKIHYVEKRGEPKAPREVPKPAVTTVIVEETERGFPDGSTTPIRLTSFAQGCPEHSRRTLTISAERDRSTDFSTVENLQEGIVFSVILGPPKAYRFLGLYSKKPS